MREQVSKIWSLFRIFAWVSAVTLGGGLAMLPLLQREFVENRSWMRDEDMVDTIAVMQTMPGIIAMNMGVLIGFRIAGVAGAIAAVFGSLLTPFIAIVLLAGLFLSLQGNAMMDHAFSGIRSVVCALMLLSTVKLARQIINGKFACILAMICLGAFIFGNVQAIWIMLLSAVAGILFSFHKGLDVAKTESEKEKCP